MTTTNTTTANNIIKVTEGTMAGDVFYGSFDTTVKDKKISVIVSNHIKDVNKKYEFRVASKCKAGFISISDSITTPIEIISSWNKNNLINGNHVLFSMDTIHNSYIDSTICSFQY